MGEKTGDGPGGVRGLLAAAVELIVPVECGGCRAPGVAWCRDCRAAFLVEPRAVRPRAQPPVPVWAIGPYGGARRGAVIAAKERGRTDLLRGLGAALAVAITRLRIDGHIAPAELAPLVLVPAPTRRAAARRRGGDPVARIAGHAAVALGRHAGPAPTVWPGPVTTGPVRDSVGLSARERGDNLAGRVRLRGAAGPVPGPTSEVLIVDDVVTTGATIAETVRVLTAVGVPVRGALTLVHA